MNIIRTEFAFPSSGRTALTVLIILTVARVSLGRSIQAVIFLEGPYPVLGLRGGPPGGDCWLAAGPSSGYVSLILGVLVLSLQVFLQPGHASLVE